MSGVIPRSLSICRISGAGLKRCVSRSIVSCQSRCAAPVTWPARLLARWTVPEYSPALRVSQITVPAIGLVVKAAPGPNLVEPDNQGLVNCGRKGDPAAGDSPVKANLTAFGNPAPPAAIQHPDIAVAVVVQRPPETGGVEAQVIVVSHHQGSVADAQALAGCSKPFRRLGVDPAGFRVALVVVRQVDCPGDMPPQVAGLGVQVHHHHVRVGQGGACSQPGSARYSGWVNPAPVLILAPLDIIASA